MCANSHCKGQEALVTMKNLMATLVLSAAILAPRMAVAQDHHDDRMYHDNHHKDDHHWNDHEDRAWRIYREQHHRKYVSFEEAKERDRQDYWAWRHNHSDALLKIDIR
jgi:Ni/Co efflux regulator RcnB